MKDKKLQRNKDKPKLKSSLGKNRVKNKTKARKVKKEICHPFSIQLLKKYAVVELKDSFFSLYPNIEKGNNRFVVQEIDFRQKYVLLKCFDKVFSVGFNHIETVVENPKAFIEKSLFGLRTMIGFHKQDSMIFRWFESELVADFSLKSNNELTVDIKEPKLFKTHFKSFVNKIERIFKKVGISIQSLTINKIKNEEDKMKAILFLLSNYIIDKDCFSYSLESYIKKSF